MSWGPSQTSATSVPCRSCEEWWVRQRSGACAAQPKPLWSRGEAGAELCPPASGGLSLSPRPWVPESSFLTSLMPIPAGAWPEWARTPVPRGLGPAHHRTGNSVHQASWQFRAAHLCGSSRQEHAQANSAAREESLAFSGHNQAASGLWAHHNDFHDRVIF